ncbi:hypothetical protein EYF80_051447 [Liparis tanakae]|uniref:Uncharacterized protein n=1 Tax=Liparis tanakae TaxID=230148 RepID=A0A4Z2FBU7_9TELE|nr:hypothetical protein EYF80_051447 [Liparis tanakae]
MSSVVKRLDSSPKMSMLRLHGEVTEPKHSEEHESYIRAAPPRRRLGSAAPFHPRDIFLSVETDDTDRSGFPSACSTRGSTLLSITGWSASHSARAPGGRATVQRLDVVDADPGDEADEAGDDVGVVHVYRLRYGLEAVEQSFGVLEEEEEEEEEEEGEPPMNTTFQQQKGRKENVFKI